ncbi:MAG: tRNA pseudouridine(55) synthase TruB [Clostridia bacterium]|nr:tRNA pseudouridine(55) synthase TruB [Clostridia bacterium]
MRDGILVLYKPQHWTSSDCVAVCRRALGVKGVKKVGHGGTLDPMATGVLPVFVGQATRIMEYMELDTKTYVCAAKLGVTTDTLDIWGEVTSQQPWEQVCASGGPAGAGITKASILEAIASFHGEIEQIPPKYSAVRVEGRRLYEYAYKGKEIDFAIKPRKVFVDRIVPIDVDLETGQFAFEIECSKGTYVRTICSDIGEKLGCGCTMTALERTAVGPIRIEQAVISAEDVKTMCGEGTGESGDQAEAGSVAERLERMLLPADEALVHFGKITMPAERAAYFRMGNSVWMTQVEVTEETDPEVAGLKNARGRDYALLYRVYEAETGEFLGTGYIDTTEGRLKADKVFAERR